jgi:5-deoxy-glucuronate isomerase
MIFSVDDALVRGPREGFPLGPTSIHATQALAPVFSMDLTVVRQRPGERLEQRDAQESAWILLSGAAEVRTENIAAEIRRTLVFEENPSALHAGPSTSISLRAFDQGAEWIVVRTPNHRRFAPRLFTPDQISGEARGAGLVQESALRSVKLIFDRTSRSDSNLVIGEVINLPGRWSSYPPHHHDQPEIYHYRFSDPAGYGHAEIGDDVVKVRSNDTVFIPPGRDHAQVAAPGYGMYYLWAIRHLPDKPYTGFTFSPEHAWALDPARQGWRPRSSLQAKGNNA